MTTAKYYADCPPDPCAGGIFSCEKRSMTWCPLRNNAMKRKPRLLSECLLLAVAVVGCATQAEQHFMTSV
jgi:hypothetical protein